MEIEARPEQALPRDGRRGDHGERKARAASDSRANTFLPIHSAGQPYGRSVGKHRVPWPACLLPVVALGNSAFRLQMNIAQKEEKRRLSRRQRTSAIARRLRISVRQWRNAS